MHQGALSGQPFAAGTVHACCLSEMQARTRGFTLLELLVVVAIIGILVAIAIPAFHNYRIRAYDAAAQTDLRNSMTAIQAAISGGDPLPGSPAQLEQYGHRLSPGVSFTRYSVGSEDGVRSVHMHVQHDDSPNAWHADYPAEGGNIEIR